MRTRGLREHFLNSPLEFIILAVACVALLYVAAVRMGAPDVLGVF